MTYIKQLDAFRFFAFLGVIIAHLLRIENPILAKLPFGYGVNLFFVLSGFLITKLLLNYKNNPQISKSHALKNFYIKRTIRIFPIYYGTIILLYLIQFQNYKTITPWLLTYSSNIYSCLGKSYPGSYNHLWSLAVEEQFYLIWPCLILFLPQRFILKAIYISIIVSLAFKASIYAYYGGWHPSINAFTISCIDSFGLGGLIAYWDRYNKGLLNKIISKKWILLLVTSFFLALKYFPLPPLLQYVDVYSNFLFSLIAFFLLIPASQDAYTGWFKKLIENKVIIHLGKISYGLYLYHLFMPDLFNYLVEKNILSPHGNDMKFCIYFLMCWIISELSWHLIERPINGLKKFFN
jgi:peptidoglycan/LPS O-acetylase OafA/YrhL